MAGQKTFGQGQINEANIDGTPNASQDSATEGTGVFHAIDLPPCTAAVQKVLTHNLKVAQRDPTYTALATTSKISTSIELNPIFTVLQRPIDLTFEWEKRPWLNVNGGPTPLRIIPFVHLPFPEATVGAPTLAYWRFSNATRILATLTRFGKTSTAQPLEQALGIREMATFTYVEPLTNSSTPIVKFQPHEREIQSRGAGNVQATESLMSLMQDRWGSSKYMVDLPGNLGGLTVMWVFSHIEGFADGRLIANPQREEELASAETLKLYADKAAKKREASTTSPTQVSDSANDTTPTKSLLSIFPVQNLVDVDTGRILATYTRSAPLSKTAGTLTIFPKLVAGQTYPYECLSSELIESIVIVTAAMVDVQTRNGVLAGLREAGAESMRWLEEPPHPLRSDP